MKAKREWCLLVNGRLLRDYNDMPLLLHKEIAEANCKARKNCVMLKVGRDIELGGE